MRLMMSPLWVVPGTRCGLVGQLLIQSIIGLLIIIRCNAKIVLLGILYKKDKRIAV